MHRLTFAATYTNFLLNWRNPLTLPLPTPTPTPTPSTFLCTLDISFGIIAGYLLAWLIWASNRWMFYWLLWLLLLLLSLLCAFMCLICWLIAKILVFHHLPVPAHAHAHTYERISAHAYTHMRTYAFANRFGGRCINIAHMHIIRHLIEWIYILYIYVWQNTFVGHIQTAATLVGLDSSIYMYIPGPLALNGFLRCCRCYRCR